MTKVFKTISSLPKGAKYVGESKSDQMHGQGTLTIANVGKYAGEFQNNKYHGQGTLTCSNGDKYVGEWQKNLVHGHGTYTYANGSRMVGRYQKGFFHGKCTLITPYYECEMEFDEGIQVGKTKTTKLNIT